MRFKVLSLKFWIFVSNLKLISFNCLLWPPENLQAIWNLEFVSYTSFEQWIPFEDSGLTSDCSAIPVRVKSQVGVVTCQRWLWWHWQFDESRVAGWPDVTVAVTSVHVDQIQLWLRKWFRWREVSAIDQIEQKQSEGMRENPEKKLALFWKCIVFGDSRGSLLAECVCGFFSEEEWRVKSENEDWRLKSQNSCHKHEFIIGNTFKMFDQLFVVNHGCATIILTRVKRWPGVIVISVRSCHLMWKLLWIHKWGCHHGRGDLEDFSSVFGYRPEKSKVFPVSNYMWRLFSIIVLWKIVKICSIKLKKIFLYFEIINLKRII